MRVKICGIRDMADAEIAIQAGANALGFLVGITHLAEDKIEASHAKEIIEKLPPFVSSALVTHLTAKEEVIALSKYLRVNTVQLHDHLEPEDVQFIKDALPFCKIIKAVHITTREQSIDYAKQYQNICHALLTDTRTADRLGGTGITHDWRISQELVKAVDCPVILAGGLNPDNVGDAVKQVAPFGIDVNSGVEVGGKKDLQRIKTFIRNAATY